MQTHLIDTPALVFAVKFIMVILVLLSAAHFGVDALATHYFTRVYAQDSAPPELTERERAQVRAATIEADFEPKPIEYVVPRVIEHAHIDAHIPGEGKFVGADLTTMKLELYEDGKLKASYDILSKGRPGSPWETPAGMYAINTKERDHFSSIGSVHMPYSMQFFGNYFIHGWPYYSGGKPVGEGYSGGCIRLSTEDAAAVFAFVDVATPLYVYDTGEDEITPKKALKLNDEPAPNLSSVAYIVADLETGDVLLEKNSQFRRPIASITKLMTALVAYETISYDKPIPLPYKGRQYTIETLVYPLLLRSDNAVSNALAAYHGTDNFLAWMNQKARAIGMKQTTFEDPSGLSYNNVSTAADLFRLARYLYIKNAHILASSKEKSRTIYSIDGASWSMTNQNRYAGDAHFVGGKLGFTDEAKKTGFSVFAVPVAGEIRTVAVIVLGSNDWGGDTNRLIAWLGRAVEAD